MGDGSWMMMDRGLNIVDPRLHRIVMLDHELGIIHSESWMIDCESCLDRGLWIIDRGS